MKIFLTIHSIIYLIFALVLFFMPYELWPIYGMQVNDEYAKFLSQHNSIFLGGIGFIGLFLINIELNTQISIQILKGLFTTNLLGFIITFYACINGYFSGFGWSDPIFFLVLALISLIQIRKLKTA